MRLSSATRIRTWVLAYVDRMRSQLAPRKSANKWRASPLRSRRELVIENAVLRHQINVFRRRSQRPETLPRGPIEAALCWPPGDRLVHLDCDGLTTDNYFNTTGKNGCP